MINIALDAFGGDHSPAEPVKGAILAVKEYPISVTLVGDESQIRDLLSQYSEYPKEKINIVHSSEVVGMAESPSKSFRQKKDSSIQVGLNLVRDKKCHGFVSAGNTGAVLATSTLVLGRSPHVERPGLAAVIPSLKSHFILLDVGSNVDCKPIHLIQFALMGTRFSKAIMGIENPKIGLLNIGEERDKGNQLTLETHQLFETLNLNFIGNVESREILMGVADVVVCDGFMGNGLIKFGEGITSIFTSFFKEEAKHSWMSLLGLMLLKPAFKRFRKKFDYDEYGGAHLLGVNGVSVVAHGRAKDIAIKNAIRIAYKASEERIVDKISSSISDNLQFQAK